MARLTRVPIPSEASVEYPDGSAVHAARTATAVIGRGVFRAGHKWSIHVKPIEGTDLCEVAHLGIVIEGRMIVTMGDGTREEFGPGDVFDIPPGHDAEIPPDADCVCIGFTPRRP
jgi:hypothetical protein